MILGFGLLMALVVRPAPAEASVDAGQIFVRTADAEGLEAAVAAWLERFAARDDATRSDLWVRRDGGRRVVVLPPKDGWALVVEGANDRADQALARHLAEALETETIWIEVAGSRLAWRYAHRQGAARVSEGAEPAAVFAEAEGAEMPAYPDAEEAAWDWLAARGVPAAYRMVHAGDLQRARTRGEGTVDVALFQVARGEGALAVSARRADVRLPRRGDAPPVVIDTVLPGTASGPGDPGQGIDLVRLMGTVSDASLTQLVQTLRSIGARYTADGRRFCHVVEDPYRVAVYERLAREEGPCQDLHRRMLERARQEAESAGERPRPRPTR
jgi:hypothetical protein